jgi:hypothetical protein
MPNEAVNLGRCELVGIFRKHEQPQGHKVVAK